MLMNLILIHSVWLKLFQNHSKAISIVTFVVTLQNSD